MRQAAMNAAFDRVEQAIAEFPEESGHPEQSSAHGAIAPLAGVESAMRTGQPSTQSARRGGVVSSGPGAGLTIVEGKIRTFPLSLPFGTVYHRTGEMFRMISNPPPGNWLLKTLSPQDQALVAPHLERVSIKRGDLLEAAGEPIPYVYFPDEGLISIIARMRDGKPVEVGMIGREGTTGASVVLDDLSALNEGRVQIGGAAVRIPSAVLRSLCSKSPSLHAVFLRYVQVLTSQVAQTAVAAAHLTVQARLARWLLMVQDRVGSDQFSLTHELLAMMLGVRRPGVTVAMHMLEGEHLIRSTRAKVQIVDRDGLEALVSTSYGIPEGLYRRLFPNADVIGGPDRPKPASS